MRRYQISVDSDLCYTPIRRRYFGLAPSNPRLSSQRLREDFMDWYMNVYLRQQEDFLWQEVCRLISSMIVYISRSFLAYFIISFIPAAAHQAESNDVITKCNQSPTDLFSLH